MSIEVTDADREALEEIDDALGFLMENEREIVLQAFARHRIATRPASTPAEPVAERAAYRHKKRGTTYDVIGTAELQMATDSLVDGSELVVYRGQDGKLWARWHDEFHDGRFELVVHDRITKEPSNG